MHLKRRGRHAPPGASAGVTAAGGYNDAILMTLAILFSMVGAFGWHVFRAVKRAERLERERSDAD